MTARQHRQYEWKEEAYTKWYSDSGRSSLNQCINDTAPPWATEDDRREILALLIAETQALHDLIMSAVES